MKAIIVVAGAGTRFLPASKSIPKEMMPLVDKPVVHYLVDEAVGSGVKELIFVISHEKAAIKNYFIRNLNLEKFLLEKKKLELLKKVKNIHSLAKFYWAYQRKRLGDGHAVLCAKRFIKKNEPVAILFGDDIIDSKTPVLKQMMKIYKRYKKPVVALEKVSWQAVSKYGVVRAKKIKSRIYKIQDIIEKPIIKEAPSNLTVVGKYIMTPKFLEYLNKTKISDRGEIGIADALHGMLLDGEDIYGYEFQGKRFDCGNIAGYLKAQLYFGLKRPKLKKELRLFIKSLL